MMHHVGEPEPGSAMAMNIHHAQTFGGRTDGPPNDTGISKPGLPGSK